MTTLSKLGEYRIPELNLSGLIETLDKISKKLKRLGLPTLEVVVGEGFDVAYIIPTLADRITANENGYSSNAVAYNEKMGPLTKFIEDGRVRYKKFFMVTLSGQVPRLAGWSFVATLQHLWDAEKNVVINMLRTIPSFEGDLPVGYRSASAENCDHCRRAIRTRKETFIVLSDKGEWKQIGRSCTQDFLGGLDPHAVAKGLELFLQAVGAAGEGEEGFGGGCYVSERYPLKQFLSVVAMFVRKYGWISRGRARENEDLHATADSVLDYLGPPPRDCRAAADHRKWVDENPVLEQDLLNGEKAYAYAREDLADKGDNRNDYEHNLYVACVQEGVDHRTAGISASLVPYYLREVERQALKDTEERMVGKSEFVGQVKDRLRMKLKVIRLYTTDGGVYGPSHIHTMVDEKGNSIVWFSSNSENNLQPGAEVVVDATVKAHKEFRGVKQTTVVRLVALTEEFLKEEIEKNAAKAARAAKKAAKLSAATV